jgi:NitT/TauT family transport system substrate-binding protein
MKKGPAILVVVIVLILAALLFVRGVKKTPSDVGPASSQTTGKTTRDSDGTPINVCVVTWGGYAGGQYFNNGFKASKESRYYKDYGIQVAFLVIDDYQNSRDAWKAGKCDLLWTTADSFPTEAAALRSFEPQILFQADWSRGGDAIVVSRGINTANDLRGKKVSVAFGTPSHTFLLKMLEASNLRYDEITVVEAPSAVDSATYFKAGKVDAAVVWSPDDDDCVKNVPGSKVLLSTKKASNIIADVFYAKKNYVEKHHKELVYLIKGWLQGAAEINNDAAAKEKAVKILSAGLNQPEDFIRNAIKNVRLATYGDNMDFFGLNHNYTGMKGEELYISMTAKYTGIKLVTTDPPSWRNVVDVSLLKEVDLTGKEHASEVVPGFNPVDNAAVKTLSTYPITIAFPTGSAVLDENARYIIDDKLSSTARGFAQTRVVVEGNTDNVGSDSVNKRLSLQRAQAVVRYLTQKYNFDPKRFTVYGNGPSKPVAGNDTPEGRAKNRRTDFKLVEG